MKRNLTLTIITVSTLFFSLKSQAQIDNLVNLSAEWVRSGTRNAATDAADVMVYNPAGMSRLQPGFHVNVGNQSFFRKPEHEYDYGMGNADYKYQQNGNDLLVPNIYLSYNKNNWCIFGGEYIAGGGATANFPMGSLSTDLVAGETIGALDAPPNNYGYTNDKNAFLKASSAYYASVLGGSYSINDKLSFGLFARYIIAQNSTQAALTITDANGVYPDVPMSLNANYNASGIGAVAGIDYHPCKKLNLAIRYESQTKLDFETKTIHDDFGMAPNGQMNRRDLPGVLGMGLSYSLNDKLKMNADFNYYFQTMADWGTTTLADGKPQQTSTLAGNSSTYAISLEYKIVPKLMVSLGGVYSLFSYTNEAGYYTNLGAYETVPENNLTICTGLRYSVTEKININLGYLHSFYAKNNTVQALNLLPADVPVTVNNSINGIAIGADFNF